MTTNIFETKEQYLAFRSAWAQSANDKNSHLRAEHFALYNLLRGKPIERGFTPITNRTKLQNGIRLNHGLYFAAWEVKRAIEGTKKTSPDSWTKATIERLLAPFHGTVTVEMLAKLATPKVESIEPTFGIGRQIADNIISGNTKIKSFDDLFALIKQAA